MKSHCHHCSFKIMFVIKITEVFTGCINNSSERSLQNLMASCIQWTFDNSKICECTQKITRSAQIGKRWPQPNPSTTKKDAPLFSNENTYQVTHFVCRFEATRMKLSMQNSRVTASQTWKLCLLNATLQGKKKKKSQSILFLKGRKQL